MQFNLNYAVIKNDLNRVRELLRSGCDVNNYTRDEYNFGCTYLHLARNSTITREVLLHGANVDARNTFWCTPIEEAIKQRIWSLIFVDHECKEEKIKDYILFRNNEDFVRSCIGEVHNLRLYNVGELLIPDLFKISTYNRKQLQIDNRDFSEIMEKFPIYGLNIVTCMEHLIKRRNLMNDFDNLTLTSERNDTGEEVRLNIYCMREISTYLNNNDLENFTKSLRE